MNEAEAKYPLPSTAVVTRSIPNPSGTTCPLILNLQRTLITLSLVLFCGIRANAQITGIIDGVYYKNGLTVAAGWACDYGHPESVAVHLYAGGAAGTGTFVNAATANLPSDSAVAAVCGSTGSNYRFEVEIGNYQAANVGKRIYVHGISISGGPNYTIDNSGTFIFPDSIFGYMIDSPIQIHVSAQYAGAVDSIYWRNQQFVNDSDHGRQFQLAAQFHGWGECYNPTEAGDFDNEDGSTSSSVLTYLGTYDNFLYTRNDPAFWLRSGETSPYCTDSLGGDGVERTAKNTANPNLSTYQFAKTVMIGFHPMPGFPNNIVEFNSYFFIPSAQNETPPYIAGDGMQLESPSGWMPPSFSNFYEYTLPTTAAAGTWTQLNPYSAESRWRRQPVVLEDPSTGNAIGEYSPDILNSPTAWFVWNNFWGSTDGSDASWLSLISRVYGPVPQGGVVTRKAYLVFGTRNEVQSGLDNLHCYFAGICH